MSKGVEFYTFVGLAPPYTSEGPTIYGRSSQGLIGVVAQMNDYYSVSAEEQRQMVENTIALCEVLYAQQENNHEPRNRKPSLTR